MANVPKSYGKPRLPARSDAKLKVSVVVVQPPDADAWILGVYETWEMARVAQCKWWDEHPDFKGHSTTHDQEVEPLSEWEGPGKYDAVEYY